MGARPKRPVGLRVGGRAHRLGLVAIGGPTAARTLRSLVVVVACAGLVPACFLLDGRSRDAGESPRDAGAGADATQPRDARPAADAATPCVPSDRTTWRVESFDAGGWYDRFAPALSGVPWVAVNEHEGNIVFLELGVDATGIVVRRRVDLPDSPVYPLAFDTDGTRFALLATSGHNWNGTPSLWLLDTGTGATAYADFPEIGPESAFTYRATLGLVGPNVMVASVSAADDLAWIEIRDARLTVLERVEHPETLSIVGARTGESEIALYLRARSMPRAAFTIDATTIAPRADAGGTHEIIGGLGELVVEHDTDFRIRSPERVWSGEWPHSQISPPAVLRVHESMIAFSLQKELSGTVGYTDGDALSWLDVASVPGASGIGVAMLPVVEARRLGLFYLGLEIPRPEQPIRYYGIACD